MNVDDISKFQFYVNLYIFEKIIKIKFVIILTQTNMSIIYIIISFVLIFFICEFL